MGAGASSQVSSLSDSTQAALNGLPEAAKKELLALVPSLKPRVDLVAKMFAKTAGADGKIDHAELRPVLLAALANCAGGKEVPRAMSVDNAMSQFDTDRSGKLSLDEFRRLHATLFAPATAKY